MAAAAERMRSMRDQRLALGLLELGLMVADPRSHAVQQRIATQIAALSDRAENDALAWLESVSEFGGPDA